MRYKDESMNELHEELVKTGVISTDFKRQIEMFAQNAIREAYDRGQKEFLSKFVTEICKKCSLWTKDENHIQYRCHCEDCPAKLRDKPWKS